MIKAAMIVFTRVAIDKVPISTSSHKGLAKQHRQTSMQIVKNYKKLKRDRYTIELATYDGWSSVYRFASDEEVPTADPEALQTFWEQYQENEIFWTNIGGERSFGIIPLVK